MIANNPGEDRLTPRGWLAAAVKRAGLALAILALGAAEGVASPILYGIRADEYAAPQTLVAVSAPNGPVTEIRSLGDGSVGYGGGLAWDAAGNRFFAYESDPYGLLSLVSLTLSTGPDVLIPGFGYGTAGGLAYTGSELYGLVNDGFGDSTLVSFDLPGAVVQPLFGLGQGFNGGLAWNPADSTLYAIQNDVLGESTLMRIDFGAQSAIPVKALGFGFYGGLAIDPLTGVYWAVGSDGNAAGTLYDISTGPVPVAATGTGYGYLLASLSLGPEEVPGGAVPEPATIWLAGIGVLGLLWIRRKQNIGKEND